MKGYPIPVERLLHILPVLSYTLPGNFPDFMLTSLHAKKTPKNTGQIKGLDIGMG